MLDQKKKADPSDTTMGHKGLLFLLALSSLSILARQFFAVPIRVYLPSFWYLPEILGILTISILCIRDFANKKFWIPIILFFLFSWAIFSLLSLSIYSIMFELRLCIIIFIGFYAGREIIFNNKYIAGTLNALCFVLILSIFYDHYYGFSWPALSFENIAGGVKDISRTWWASYGERRINGFAISSTEAALLIACSVVMLIANNKRALKSFFVFMAICVVAIAALYFTRQTATMALFLFFFVTSMIGFLIPPQEVVYLRTRIFKFLYYLAFFAFMLTPFILYKADTGSLLGDKSSSFNERTLEVWPNSIDRLFSLPTIMIGDGLGSVGEAASYTDIKKAVPPDNMFLFVAIQSGLPIALIFFFIAAHRVMRASDLEGLHLSSLAVLTLVTFNGITANIFEGLTACFFYGYCLGNLGRYTCKDKPQLKGIKLNKPLQKGIH